MGPMVVYQEDEKVVSAGLRAGRRSPPGDDSLLVLVDAYRDHSTAVYGLAARVCGRSGADDVTQEVFIRLWRQPERFDSSRGSLRTFLLTMTHNMAVDRLRSAGARSDREGRFVRLDSTTSDDVEADALWGVTRQQILAAVDGLPPRERDAIVMAFYGRCTYQEAAQRLGEPTGTVKGRIRSGLRHLAAELSDSSNEDPRPSGAPAGPLLLVATQRNRAGSHPSGDVGSII
ncbi:MAG: hypothetical protein NVS3B21_00230 [Acidimicrobiales bacterium]